MNLPTICIVTAAARVDLNRVWDAMGRGPATFSIALCEIDPEATWETPATHYGMQDMGAQKSDVDSWLAMASDNDLPSLPAGVVWGENGVISAQDAQAAISPGNLLVFPAGGLANDQERNAWRDGVYLGLDLQLVPYEPI